MSLDFAAEATPIHRGRSRVIAAPWKETPMRQRKKDQAREASAQQERTLQVVHWKHFVPDYDKYFDVFA
jgi:hypothetical protein